MNNPRMTPHTDSTAKDTVETFCNQVFWLRTTRRIYKELFEEEDSRILMEKTASSFFSHLSTVLQNYLLLEFVKITDPPRTGKNENLTVENIVVSIDWPAPVKDKLQALSKKTRVFRGYVLEARNKLLAHSDKDAFLAGKPLGAFPEGEDETFLKTLEEICNLAHEVCFGSVFGHLLLAAPGDVIDFKKSLFNSIAFDQLLSESEGQEKIKLYSYLQKARQQKGTKAGS
jgi:hypothetical protein